MKNKVSSVIPKREVPIETELLRPERRTFLKFVTIGGMVIVAGLLVRKIGDFSTKGVSTMRKSLIARNKRQNIGNAFSFIEGDKELTVYDKKGQELFILEKDV